MPVGSYNLKLLMIIAAWNVMDLNQSKSKRSLGYFLDKHRVEFFGCLETRVKEKKAQRLLRNIGQGWTI